jgi:shikimate 5-dehydrogenase
MIYHPAVTPLMEAAASAGARVKGGVEMFEAQAAESLRIWTTPDSSSSGLSAFASLCDSGFDDPD